jgi:ribonuclease R
VKVLRALGDLAQRIEARRRAAGMLHLDLPEIELVLDAENKVVDALPADDSYTHTMIEMFMVEANEAVARTLARHNRHFLRRIHPPPDLLARSQLTSFVGAAGFKISRHLERKEIQRLLHTVRGRPESYAVNLAVLKTFQQAEYSPRDEGHYALASDCYCHFTSPIRRYPDLTVHRLVAAHCRGVLHDLPPEGLPHLLTLGEQLTAAEQAAEAAEQELREVLILQFLENRIGDTFDGVITGVTNFGIFVQSPRFLVEGVVRMEDLGDDWWDVNARYGFIRGERTGRTFKIGHTVRVTIAGVDVPRRQLHLRLAREPSSKKAQKRRTSGERRRTAKKKKEPKKGRTRKSPAKRRDQPGRRRASQGGPPAPQSYGRRPGR